MESSYKIPFVYGRTVDDPFFVNRTPELTRLTTNFISGLNTVIVSPRRWGKSSLVNKAAQQVMGKHQNVSVCKLDLFNIRTEKEFYESYAREVLKCTSPKWEEWLENGKKFLKGIVPRFSFGIDPQHEFSVSFDMSTQSKNITEILDLPETIGTIKKKKVIVCIDEFQNLGFYEDPLSFQKRLRSAWQHHKHVSYCLYGSKRHMMTEIFESKSMPFYKFGDTLFLKKISTEHWVDFIVNAFRKTGKEITPVTASVLPETVKEHPYFVQQLAQKVWTLTEKKATEKTVAQAIDELLDENSILYLRELENLSNMQVNFLKAICDNVQQLSAAETLRNYNLGTSANVLRIKSALEQKEVLDFMNSYPEFIDPLFESWMKKIYFNFKADKK